MVRQLKRPSQSLGDQEGRKGGSSTPLAIIWPCTSSASSYAAAGKDVLVPAQRCPECLGWLTRWGGYWRWLRAPLLIERIWIRRGRCSVCRRSHALLLARRLDEVAVIGQAVALKAGGDHGLRPIAEQLGVPHATARTWWSRFELHAPMMIAGCTALAVAFDGTPVMLHTTGERAALDALGVVWERARVRFGQQVGQVWAVWSRVSGGYALGTNTTSPWAGGSRTAWMAPSAFGGPGP
jgi:hypothetical protein